MTHAESRKNECVGTVMEYFPRFLTGYLGRLRPGQQDGGADTEIEGRNFLLTWLILGTVIGIVAGLGAVLLSRAIHLATSVLLVGMADYQPPMPFGEGQPILHAIGRPWLIPVVTTLGGLISGFIVFRWAPEAEGHGTDAAIESIHFRNATSNPKVPPIKLIASAITIGSGGSGGREGPTAQISAGFASLFTTWLRLSPDIRRIAVSAGMGAGIGAIFRAPLGGALMAAEILYIHDIEVSVLIPALISSIVAYSVFGMFEGWEPIFGAQPGIAFSDPVTLIWYVVLGLLAGAGGLLYARTFYGTQALFHRLALPQWIKPAVGGLVVGLMGLVVHDALGTGYGWVQIAMTDQLRSMSLWVIVALPFAKMISTSLSIGSGGSGGIFGPGMVIGGMLGATMWRLGDGVLPHLPDSPAPFVIVGMMALFGSVAHAPFAMMLMVAEMTGNLSLLAPAMISVAVATAVVSDTTIYRSQLPDRTWSPAHRRRMSFPLLRAITVVEAIDPDLPIPDRGGPTLPDNAPLDAGLAALADSGAQSLTVMRGDVPLGVLTVRSAVAKWQRSLASGTARLRAVPSASVLVETTVLPGASVAGKTLREIALPPGAMVLSILRAGDTVLPTADTALEGGDLVTAVAPIGRLSEVKRRLSS